MRDPRKEIVEAGYDVLADGFLAWSASIEDDPRERFLGSFADRLPNGARVLDLASTRSPRSGSRSSASASSGCSRRGRPGSRPAP